MNKSHFKLKKVTSLEDLRAGNVEVPTSDYAITTDKEFIQFEFVDESTDDGKPILNKGVYELAEGQMGDIVLKELHVNPDKILKEYSVAETVKGLLHKVFDKLHVYEKRKSFPKRAALLYSAPGCGKTSSILEAITEYVEKDTAVIFWPTAKLRSYHVIDFLKEVEYRGASKLILVVEDVGGYEHNVGEKVPVDASLLAMLDNSTGAFKVPTMVLATTNYPGNLAEPLLRTGRFDDLVEVKGPNADQRVDLIKFFAEDLVSKEPGIEEELRKDKYKDFSVSDIKEIILKSELEDIPLKVVLEILHKRKEVLKANFENRSSLGF
jgi:SpoVK/Ycf46/Vps4 family AAA+-type ATPase